MDASSNKFKPTDLSLLCASDYTKMDILQQSALAWKELTEYRYQFVYGYKKTLYPINLTFSYADFPHLSGFQYLKDLSLPNYTSAKIVDRILEGKITFKQIQKAAQYEEMVKPRLEALIHLRNSLDNDSFRGHKIPLLFSISSFRLFLYCNNSPNNSL